MRTDVQPLRKGANIALRLEEFGVACLKIAVALPRGHAYRNVAQQLARAGTAAGANYEEARSAESRADFIHKVKLAAKEVGESNYWLRLARGAGAIASTLADPVIREALELAAILNASARTARHNGPH
jgi:four helix bundle protein